MESRRHRKFLSWTAGARVFSSIPEGCFEADSTSTSVTSTSQASKITADSSQKKGGIMRVTITGISRIAREVKSTPPQGLVTHSAPSSVGCRRCGGMLVEEHCMDMDLGLMERGQWARRCIQCGDMIDEIILRNRSASRQMFQEIGPTAGIEHPFAALPPRNGKGGRYAFVSYTSPTVWCHPPLRTIGTNR
jgi:hypothetical protein